MTGLFEPGTYTVFADARERDSTGHYSILLETAPPAGSGAPGDGCGDAPALVVGSGTNAGTVNGDTFAARDDVAGTCGGAGAPDLVYRLDVQRRSRLVASLDGEEASHVLIVWRRCADRTSELACGRSVDQVLAPGTYYVGVDGAAPDAFGRFTLAYALRDLTGQGGACGTAPLLSEGRMVNAQRPRARPTSSSRRAVRPIRRQAVQTGSSSSSSRRERRCGSRSWLPASMRRSPSARDAATERVETSSLHASLTPTAPVAPRSSACSKRERTGSSSTDSPRTIRGPFTVEYRTVR